MADNFAFTEGSGKTGAADDVSGVLFPKVKIVDGTADSDTVVAVGVGAAANALRVALSTSSEIIANLSATDNAVLDAMVVDLAAIEVLLTTMDAVLDTIKVDTEAIETAVEGTLTVDATGQGDVPITLDGEEITANLGVTDNAVLDAIQAAVEAVQTAIEATLTVSGTVDLGATDNAVLDAIKAAVEIIDNAIDVVAALPAGTNAIGKLAANSGVDIGDVDVTSIAAGENHLGDVGMPDTVITVTPTLDTSAYADGDVLFTTAEIASAVRNNGDSCILQSITVLDKADQGIDFELVFLNADNDLGTINAAISISDANAATIIGHYAFSNDYVDLIGSQLRCDSGIGMVLKAGAATTSLYVAGISKGAGTYTASDIVIQFGLLRN